MDKASFALKISGGTFLLVALIISSAFPAAKVVFGTPTREGVHHAVPMLAAQEKGLWKEAGLEATWHAFRAGGALTQAVAAGSVDMGINAAALMIMAAARGLPVMMVADLKHSQDFSLYVRGDSPIREPRELAGKRFAVTRTGSISHAYGRALVNRLGIADKVKFIATGGTIEAMAAIKAGIADAVILTPYQMTKLEIEGQVRNILHMDSYFPPQWLDTLVFSRKDFARANAEATGKSVAVVLRATDYVMKNKGWAIEKVKQVTGWPEEAANKIYETLKYGRDGKINKEAVENVRRFLIEHGIVARDKAPAAEEIYSERYLP